MSNQQLDLSDRQRRAIWRANHRGMKEMDVLLGRFANENVPGMSATELADFENAIEASDADLLASITGQGPTPPQVSQALVLALRNMRLRPENYSQGS